METKKKMSVEELLQYPEEVLVEAARILRREKR